MQGPRGVARGKVSGLDSLLARRGPRNVQDGWVLGANTHVTWVMYSLVLVPHGAHGIYQWCMFLSLARAAATCQACFQSPAAGAVPGCCRSHGAAPAPGTGERAEAKSVRVRLAVSACGFCFSFWRRSSLFSALRRRRSPLAPALRSLLSSALERRCITLYLYRAMCDGVRASRRSVDGSLPPATRQGGLW